QHKSNGASVKNAVKVDPGAALTTEYDALFEVVAEKPCREMLFDGFRHVDGLTISKEQSAAWSTLDPEGLQTREARFDALDTEDCKAGSLLFGIMTSRVLDANWAETRKMVLELMVKMYGTVPTAAGAEQANDAGHAEAIATLRASRVKKSVDVNGLKLTVDRTKT